MENEMQIDTTNPKAWGATEGTKAKAAGGCTSPQKQVAWNDGIAGGLESGGSEAGEQKPKAAAKVEGEDEGRKGKSFTAAVRKIVPKRFHSKELGVKRTWKDELVDHCRWAKIRPSKSVPRYIAPIYYDATDQPKNEAKPHKCAICKSAFTRKDNFYQHERRVHSLHGLGKNPELFMAEDKGHFGVRCQICSQPARSPPLMVKHYLEGHTYRDRVKFNLEWMVEEELLDDQASIRCMLGDSTKLGKATWKEMKDEVMQDLYKNERWYKRLAAQDKLVVEDLKAAQTAQGNFEPLRRGFFNSQRIVPLVNLEDHNLECDTCPTLGDLLWNRAMRVIAWIDDGNYNPLGIEHKLKGLDMILMAMEMI